MKLTVGRLRQLFSEAMEEAKVGASPEYLKKEAVRELLQKAVTDLVKSGEIKDPQHLAEFFDAVDMSVKALKMVPLDVYKKMSSPAKGR